MVPRNDRGVHLFHGVLGRSVLHADSAGGGIVQFPLLARGVALRSAYSRLRRNSSHSHALGDPITYAHAGLL